MGIFDFIKDAENYDDRKIARVEPKENNGIGVSTCYTSDEGYETALLDANGVHPVERYKDKVSALFGHQSWVLKTRNPKFKKVKMLGAWGLVTDKVITIKRYGKAK